MAEPQRDYLPILYGMRPSLIKSKNMQLKGEIPQGGLLIVSWGKDAKGRERV